LRFGIDHDHNGGADHHSGRVIGYYGSPYL
jgi:hypothetical protein